MKKGVWLATSLKKRLWHRCFPVNFAKFLRTPILQNSSGQLLLSINVFNYFNFYFLRIKYIERLDEEVIITSLTAQVLF